MYPVIVVISIGKLYDVLRTSMIQSLTLQLFSLQTTSGCQIKVMFALLLAVETACMDPRKQMGPCSIGTQRKPKKIATIVEGTFTQIKVSVYKGLQFCKLYGIRS